MRYIVTINNNEYEVEVEHGQATLKGSNKVVTNKIERSMVTGTEDNQKDIPVVKVNGNELKAPMPGQILDIKVSVGDYVKEGDVLFILEAMKMENEVTTTRGGIIAQIPIIKGQAVATNDILAVIK